MQRLFSTFAGGAPGAGLLLLRLAAGGALLFHGVAALTGGSVSPSVLFHVLCVAIGVFLLVGLWTPVVGALAAIDAAVHGFVSPTDLGFYALLATLAAALALLGPGAWSIDARLFGWRRIDIPSGSGHGYSTRRETPP